MKLEIVSVLAATTLLLLCPDGWAASPTEQLRGLFAAATRVLDDPNPERTPEDRLSAIQAIVGESFDIQEAAQLSLGPVWSARTPPERAEFVKLFADLLERNFIFGIAARIRLADGVQVSYLGESIDGSLATVRTAVMSKSGLELPFNYKMVERGDRWAVRDVVIDGVSLAANYRAQFLRVIQASSYDDLVRHMRMRVSGTPEAPPLEMTAVSDDRPSAPASEDARPASTIASEPRPAPAMAESIVSTPAEPNEPSPPAPRALETTMATPAIDRAPTAVAFVALESAAPRSTVAVTDSPVIEDPDPRPPLPTPRNEPPSRIETTVSPRPSSRAAAYWVQVGAFANPEMARRLVALLSRQEPPGSPDRWMITATDAAGPPLARVRMGPFAARAEAVSKVHELQARGYQPFIAAERN